MFKSEKTLEKYNFIIALEKDEKRKELEEKNILVKNNSFTLTEEEKNIIEKKYNYNFTKKYFSTKNQFLYDIVKNTLEEKNYTFLSEKDLKEKLEKTLEEFKKDLKNKLLEEEKKEEEKKKEEKKN